MGGSKITKKHIKGTETIYKLQKMTFGEALRFANVFRFAAVICVRAKPILGPRAPF